MSVITLDLLFQQALFIGSLSERFNSQSPFLSPSQKATIPLIPAVFARLSQIYEVPTLLHIQTKYIVYNVVRGVTKRKAEIRIKPC